MNKTTLDPIATKGARALRFVFYLTRIIIQYGFIFLFCRAGLYLYDTSLPWAETALPTMPPLNMLFETLVASPGFLKPYLMVMCGYAGLGITALIGYSILEGIVDTLALAKQALLPNRDIGMP
jgi:hypothetical protein